MMVETDIESSTPIFSDVQEMYEFYGDPMTYRRISLPVNNFLSDDIAMEVIVKYFNRIIRSGDYYSLAKAKHMIEQLSCHPKKKEKLIEALEKTNEYGGIYNTKRELKDKELLNYKQQMSDLDILGINPVTIPRDWGEHIPNLLNAYYNKRLEIMDERLRRKWKEATQRKLLNG